MLLVDFGVGFVGLGDFGGVEEGFVELIGFGDAVGEDLTSEFERMGINCGSEAEIDLDLFFGLDGFELVDRCGLGTSERFVGGGGLVVDDVSVEGVFDVFDFVGFAVETLEVGFIFGKEKLSGFFTVEVHLG